MENVLENSYQESLDFIYSFVDFSMKRHVDDSHRFFKLDRMRKMAELLGNPQVRFPSIHVAGTKGKGSVASFCASALQAAGYKVGLYTSPHLQEFTERIQINGTQISKVDLVELVNRLRPLTEQVPEITTFELTTALCFLYFAEKHIDIVMPGYTHLQIAQPILFAHYMLAYFEMFKRDYLRLLDAFKRLNYCPLGAAALAGTNFDINRFYVSNKLDFIAPTTNSIDTVSDRDFIIELLSIISISMMHLSRFVRRFNNILY